MILENELKKIVREIKHEYNLTDADIAEQTGYSRPHFVKAVNAGGNDKVYGALQKAFPDFFQKPDKSEQDVLLYLRANLPEILEVARSIQAQLTAKIIVDSEVRGGEEELEKINSYAVDILRRARADRLAGSRGKG